MKSRYPPLVLSVVFLSSIITIALAASCSPAFGDDGAEVLVNKDPPPGLNFGGRTAEGMMPDDGTDVLRPTATPDLSFGGRSTQGMIPASTQGGAQALSGAANNQIPQKCLPKTRLTGPLVAASEILAGSPCQPAGGK